MKIFIKMLAGATLSLLATAAAHGQALAPGRDLVWPTEFSSETFSCNSFAASREKYLRVSRPAFNCTAGVDCPQDLEQGPPQEMSFMIFYSWVDPTRTTVDVTFDKHGVELIKVATERLIRNMDAVVRSKRRSIHVIGHTDTSGTAAQNLKISQTLSTCLKNMVDVSIHINGYAGAYDFPVTLDARGETEPARSTADGVREPLNRRGEITITY